MIRVNDGLDMGEVKPPFLHHTEIDRVCLSQRLPLVVPVTSVPDEVLLQKTIGR